MLVDFDSLNNTARLWVYQANNTLDEVQIAKLEDSLTEFCQNWESHQKKLKASFEIRANKFVILAVDQDINDASGCAIDKSVKLLQELEHTLSISLLDKTLLSYYNANELKTIGLKDIKEHIEQGLLTEESTIINTLVLDKINYKTQFEIIAKNSWLKRYFIKSFVS